MGEWLSWTQDAVTIIIVAAVAYHALALYEVRAFARRQRAVAQPSSLPPVTVLKPLSEWDSATQENLASFCHQRYPRYQLLVGIPPAVGSDLTALVGRVPAADTEVQWVVCTQRLATNPKVSELLHLYPLAAHDLLVFTDADIRVEPDFLARIVAPLQLPEVGVVTCLYRVREAPTWPAAVEALMTNVDFTPSVLVARRLFGLKFTLGAGIAVRRQVLEAVGGFVGLADYLADDYQIGHRASQAGYRVVLADSVVEHRLPPMGLRDLYRHQVRWARTHRVCQPTGWFFSIITHLTFWSTAWLALSGFSDAGWRLVGVTLVFRVLEGRYLNACLDGLRPFWKVAWLMPLKDLFSLTMWVLSFTGNRVHWAGREFVVSRDGRMREVGEQGSKGAGEQGARRDGEMEGKGKKGERSGKGEISGRVRRERGEKG